MNEWLTILGIIIGIILFGIGGIIGSESTEKQYQKEAIEHGHAEYLTSEGNRQIFHWK